MAYTPAIMARPFDHLPPTLHRLGPPAGQARREILLLHGAWLGPDCWRGLAEPLAGAGYGLNLLELPGHGASPWQPPALTGLADYAGLARRAAAGLGRPVLLGQGLGGWLAQKILEVADLPAMLLASPPGGGLPWRGRLALARASRRGLLGLLAGRPLAPEPLDALGLGLARPQAPLAAEPARAALEMLLGLGRARPPLGRSPRLVLAFAGDRLLPRTGQARLAASLGAGLTILPGAGPLPGPDGMGLAVEAALVFLAACPGGAGRIS